MPHDRPLPVPTSFKTRIRWALAVAIFWTVSIPPGIWKLARVIHVQSLSAPPWIWLHVQGAYADADSTAMAFQAIAPVGVKHYQTYQLALSKVGQMENGQVEMGECKQPACT